MNIAEKKSYIISELDKACVDIKNYIINDIKINQPHLLDRDSVEFINAIIYVQKGNFMRNMK